MTFIVTYNVTRKPVSVKSVIKYNTTKLKTNRLTMEQLVSVLLAINNKAHTIISRTLDYRLALQCESEWIGRIRPLDVRVVVCDRHKRSCFSVTHTLLGE